MRIVAIAMLLGAQLAAADAPACKQEVAEAHIKTAVAAYTNGEFAKAFTEFDAAYTCKADSGVAAKAFMSACRAKLDKSAKVYWGRVDASRRDQLVQICLTEGIDPRK